MKRIILHWTAGAHTANDVDRRHYHFIYEYNGREVSGRFPVEANSYKRDKLTSGTYAAHTAKLNSGSIGMSVACMHGAIEGKSNGNYPMTEAQLEAMCRGAAREAIKYNIPVQRSTILTHAEVQEVLGVKQAGKWDITVIPFKPHLKGAKACGDYIRTRVQYHMNMLMEETYKPVEPKQPEPKPVPQPVQKPKTVWEWLKSLFGA